MAQRRMFSLQVVDTDAFMDMPLSAQALYFHLSMRADDDGFIDNARRIQKLLGAADDDLRILIAKGFILAFDSGVIVVKHWKISNYIQKDRYKPTQYQEEKSTLSFDLNGAYTDCLCVNIRPCIQPVSKLASEPVSTLNTELDTLNKLWLLSPPIPTLSLPNCPTAPLPTQTEPAYSEPSIKANKTI